MNDPMDHVKESLQQVRGSPLKVPGSHPHYKEHFAHEFWTKIDLLFDAYDRQSRTLDTVHSTLKLVMNQTQLAVSDVKRLEREQKAIKQELKSLPRSSEGGELPFSGEVDLKGE